MPGGMIPERNWSLIGKEFAEAQAGATQQKMLCARCVKQGNIEPPEKIVVYAGESCCGTHYQQIIDGMHDA